MAKIAKKEELTASEVIDRLAEFLDELRGTSEAKPVKGKKAEAEEEEGTESEEPGTKSKKKAEEAEEMDFPKAAKIKKMDGDELTELAEKIGLPTDDVEEDDLKTHLTTAATVLEAIEAEDNDSLDEDDVKALCKALSISPKKSLDTNVESLKEYFEGGEGAEKSEEKDESDAEDKAGAKKAEKTAKDNTEEIDPEKAVEEYLEDNELPDLAEMKERLQAYNEANEDDPIEVGKGKTKTAYKQLLEKLVDSQGNVAEWGESYIRNGEVCCCGIGLDEHTVKGKKGNFGKCLVTGKVFKVEDDGETTEVWK